jgi:hypothetical protein
MAVFRKLPGSVSGSVADNPTDHRRARLSPVKSVKVLG